MPMSRIRGGLGHAPMDPVWPALLAATLALMPGLSPAVSPPYGDETTFLTEDLPVVLSATRLSQSPHEAPAAVTVIDQDMIRTSGARSLADVLRLVPGMQAGFANANTPVITYHGLSDEFSRRMQVLVDGRSVYVPSFGGVPWISLPLALEDIARIEVIRGPNAASYGANAFLGTISIRTRHAAEEAGLYAKANAGKDDIRDGVLRAGGAWGEADFRLTGRYQRDNGFNATVDDEGRDWDNYDSYRTRSITGRLDYQSGPGGHWELQFGLNDAPRKQGSLLTDSEGNPKRTRDDYANFIQARWDRMLAPKHHLTLQFYRNEYNYNEDGTPVESADEVFPGATVATPFDADIDTVRYDLDLQHRFEPGRTLRWVWGLSARRDRVKSESWFSENGWLDNDLYRAFGNLELRPTDRLLINAGAMLEHNDFTETAFSPRLALNYQLTPRHTLRGAVSRATRTPAFIEELADAPLNAELTIPGLGTLELPEVYSFLDASGDLDSEEIVSAEVGYFGEWLAGELLVDVKLYYEEIDDLITAFERDEIGTLDLLGMPVAVGVPTVDFRNRDWVRAQGVETQIDWKPNPATFVRLGYSYTELDSSDRDEDYSNTAPRHGVVLFARHRLRHDAEVSLAYHYAGKMAWIEWDKIDSIRRLDLRTAIRLPTRGMETELAFVVQNALGPFEEFRRGNEFEARPYAQLIVRAK